MNLNEYIKSLPLKTRIKLKLHKFWSKFRIKIGLCPHDSSFGEVGEMVHTCICGKEVHNEDHKEEKKALKK